MGVQVTEYTMSRYHRYDPIEFDARDRQWLYVTRYGGRQRVFSSGTPVFSHIKLTPRENNNNLRSASSVDKNGFRGVSILTVTALNRH